MDTNVSVTNPARASPNHPPEGTACSRLTLGLRQEMQNAGSDGALFLLQIVNLKCSFLGRSTQSPFDALLHSRHEDLVPKLLPALLGVVHGDDRPAARGGSGGVKDLPGRETAPIWMHGCN